MEIKDVNIINNKNSNPEKILKANSESKLLKELIKFRHLKDRPAIQQVRKRMNSSSRFLDNYYNPKVHEKPFYAGKSKEKVSYVFDYSGLAHTYEGKNVPEKLSVEEKKKLITLEKHFDEFKELSPHEIMITIEHCSNCHEHSLHTQHINNIYLKYARSLQKSILIRYPFLRVLLKPIETDIVNIKEKCMLINFYFIFSAESEQQKEIKILGNKNNNIIDYTYKEVRIGAFEVQLFRPKDSALILLHSKLREKVFPKINSILEKINMYVPVFKLDIKIKEQLPIEQAALKTSYLKVNSPDQFSSKVKSNEEKINSNVEESISKKTNTNNEQKDIDKMETAKFNPEKQISGNENLANKEKMVKSKELLDEEEENDKFKNIEVRIYQLNNPLFHAITNYLDEELNIVFNPKKRIEFTLRQREMSFLEQNARFFNENPPRVKSGILFDDNLSKKESQYFTSNSEYYGSNSRIQENYSNRPKTSLFSPINELDNSNLSIITNTKGYGSDKFNLENSNRYLSNYQGSNILNSNFRNPRYPDINKNFLTPNINNMNKDINKVQTKYINPLGTQYDDKSNYISMKNNNKTRPETGFNRALYSIHEKTEQDENDCFINKTARLRSAYINQMRPQNENSLPNLVFNKRNPNNNFKQTNSRSNSRSGFKRPSTSVYSNAKSLSTKSGVNSDLLSNSNLNFKANNTSFNNLSLLISNNVKFKYTDGEIIEDKELASLLKGKLLVKDFIRTDGSLRSHNLPYDTYLIEICESMNLHGLASIVKFNSTKENDSNNKDEYSKNSQDQCKSTTQETNQKLFKLSREFALSKQTNSFIEIFTYTVTDDNDMEIDVVSGSKVYIKCLMDYGLEGSLYEDEVKMELSEHKKTKGKFETIVEPGKYSITCINDEYEVFCQEYSFKKGLNRVNIELKPEKKVEIEIQVIDYFSMTKVKEISYDITKIYSKSKSTVSSTSKEGVILINSMKLGEGVILNVNKRGYFPCSKTIIRKEFNTSPSFLKLPQQKQTDKNLSYNKNDANEISNIQHFNITTKVYLVSKEKLKQEGIDLLFIFYNNINLFNRIIQNTNNLNQNAPIITSNNEDSKLEKNDIIKENLNQNQFNEGTLNEYNFEKNISIDFETSKPAAKYCKINKFSKDNTIFVCAISFSYEDFSKELQRLKLENRKTNNNQTSSSDNELPHIARLSMKLLDNDLCNYYKLGKNSFNSLHLNCFEINIHNSLDFNYQVKPPSFSSQYNYYYWDIGYIDLHNRLFFELNILNLVPYSRVLFFNDWLLFLERIFNLRKSEDIKSIFGYNTANSKETIGNKSIVNNTANNKADDAYINFEDKFLHEVAFMRTLKNLFDESLSSEFMIFLADIFKNQHKMISFHVLTNKLNSNLKNFK